MSRKDFASCSRFKRDGNRARSSKQITKPAFFQRFAVCPAWLPMN
jgi:hypothetical protein